jgi:hypothetical protein
MNIEMSTPKRCKKGYFRDPPKTGECVPKEQKTRKNIKSLIEKKDVLIEQWREALDEFRSFSDMFHKIEQEYKDEKQKRKQLEKKEERLA